MSASQIFHGLRACLSALPRSLLAESGRKGDCVSLTLSPVFSHLTVLDSDHSTSSLLDTQQGRQAVLPVVSEKSLHVSEVMRGSSVVTQSPFPQSPAGTCADSLVDTS